MDEETYDNLHYDFSLCDHDVDDLLYYIVERVERELSDLRRDPARSEKLVMLLQSVVNSCESAAFEYYASTK
jgi:hypothetical protein